MQEAALRKVAERLHMQGISNVSDVTIEQRLQTAIKDLKASMCLSSLAFRAKKKPEARKPLRTTPAPAATPETTKPRSFDPIRDL
jgi:hypothetical protein